MKIIFYGVEMTEESMENGYSGPNINSPFLNYCVKSMILSDLKWPNAILIYFWSGNMYISF